MTSGSLPGARRRSPAACAVRLGRCIAASLLSLLLLAAVAAEARAAVDLGSALATVQPADLVPGADRFGPVEGAPPRAGAFEGDTRRGTVFLNTDVAGAVGYSGKPIHLLIGLDNDGTITGTVLHEHHEPIVLIGIPERKVKSFIAGYVGRNVREFLEERDAGDRSLDIIAGATVTIMVIDDAIRRSALRMARVLGLAGLGAAPAASAASRGEVDTAQAGVDDWMTLIGDGSVRRLALSVGDVTGDFANAGKRKAAARPESDDPEERFIDLYAGLVSAPVIGRSLLGEAEYENLRARLEPRQHALLIAANGLYSFKGSGFVRGGIFDRIQLAQGDGSIRFRDRHYKHLGGVEADLAQPFAEVGLFVVPADAGLDPAAPWTLQLLVQRAIGALDKDFLLYEISYTLPERYLLPPPKPAPAATTGPSLSEPEAAPELWRRIWEDRILDVAVLGAALIALTLIFFFQDWFVRRPKLATAVRVGFLLFTLAWLGGFAQAQLSVVNVVTFGNALITEFKWDYFLMDPLIFLLWCGTGIALLFWGRGVFCGWLCPFGALQELLNKAARLACVPQVTLPWGLHERLWPVKYVIFIGIFGVSLHDLALAEQLAEVEPFKTTVILRFAHDWPFVAWAGVLLGAGLFVERFFCRYLCPLGAALAIPGKIRIMEWLRRHKECGAPCHPLRPGMHGAGDPPRRAHQRERVPLLPALPAGLSRRAPLPADDSAPPQARAQARARLRTSSCRPPRPHPPVPARAGPAHPQDPDREERAENHVEGESTWTIRCHPPRADRQHGEDRDSRRGCGCRGRRRHPCRAGTQAGARRNRFGRRHGGAGPARRVLRLLVVRSGGRGAGLRRTLDARAPPHPGVQPLQRHRLGAHQREPPDHDRRAHARDPHVPRIPRRHLHQRRCAPPAHVVHRRHL